MKNLMLGVVLALVMQVAPPAKPDQAPTLTKEQQLQIQTIVQKWEIAQLRAQAAKLELEAFLASLRREGYDLDLNDINNPRYVKKKDPIKDPAKEP